MTTTITSEQRNLAVLCHVSAYLNWVLPLSTFVVLGAVWLWKRDDRWIADQAVEALNFNISLIVWFTVGTVLSVVLIGLPLLLALLIVMIVCPALGAMRSSGGVPYRYPMTIRLFTP